jgi:hypothetical protein
MEIVKRSDDMKEVVVLPHRWVVERTFSWFGRNRRLAKDFENLAESLATFRTIASIQESGTGYQRRTAAVGSVKGPSPERAPTTGLRRRTKPLPR